MRILLVQPDCGARTVGFRIAAMPEPLALEMLAACVPEHDCCILDLRVEDRLTETIEQFDPEVVAVTALTPEVYEAIDICRKVKSLSPDAVTVAGGHHASLMPTDLLTDGVDVVALGEGEAVFPELVRAVKDGRPPAGLPNVIARDETGAFRRGPQAPCAIAMDDLPLPRRDLVARYREEYFFLFDRPDSSVATGRGCPYRCNFCSVWKFYDGRTRQMSPERVLQEVRAVDTDHITFVDDNFLMNHRREDAIADLILEEGIDLRYSIECRTDSIVRHPELIEKWVEAGLYAVLLGLEGATERALADVNKQNSLAVNDEAIRILHDNGVVIWGAFIIDPDWDVDDFKALRQYVTDKGITHTQFTILTPLPGTDLYARNRDRLLTDDYRCYDTMHSVLPTRLDRREFYRQFANLYRQTDIGPYYDLVREGKLSIEDCKLGKRMLDAMSVAESYFPGDPVLGTESRRQAVLVPRPHVRPAQRSRSR